MFLKVNVFTVFQKHLFMLLCSYVIGQIRGIFITVVTPVLSDQFGFSVADISYFFMLLNAALIVTCIIQ